MHAPVALVRGGGDIATGTILRLHRAGFQVVVTEIEKPTVIRRTVAAANAVYLQRAEVEGICVVKAESVDSVKAIWSERCIPVVVDPSLDTLNELNVDLLVDATLAKRNMGLHKEMAPVVIALGPGFDAGTDCDAVVETSRGHDLGVVIYDGLASANTGIPGKIGGYAEERVLRAPAGGFVKSIKSIGDAVKAGEVIGYVGDMPFTTEITGVVRGLIHESVEVHEGMKIGDVDPRGDANACFTVSDKARALGGSVLEAYFVLTGGIKINE